MMGQTMSSNPNYCNHNIPIYSVGPTAPTDYSLATTSAAVLRFHRRLHLGFLLRAALRSVSRLDDVPKPKDTHHERALRFPGFQWSSNALSSALMSLSFFSGNESRSDSKEFWQSHSRKSRNDFFDKSKWTHILLAANVIIYVAQHVSDGNLLYWGAKINSLISQGQLWRLVTSSFLHANVGHLMVNCYSLNSVGPAVEKICGPKRFLTIYIASAIASSATSYWFCKAPAVGASGAIFGLVGSFAMFALRHRGMVKGTEGDLKHIARVIALNMTIGFLSQGIDNWGHFGGLIGGIASSWLLGPAWEVVAVTRDGRKVLADKAPIFSLIKRTHHLK